MNRRQSLLWAAAWSAGQATSHAAPPLHVAARQSPPGTWQSHMSALREAALGDRRAFELVSSLVTEVGARPAGSANDQAAVQWALKQCQALGLAAVRAEPVPLRVWQRGPAQARLTAPRQHRLVMTALGNSVGTGSTGIEAEVAYYSYCVKSAALRLREGSTDIEAVS